MENTTFAMNLVDSYNDKDTPFPENVLTDDVHTKFGDHEGEGIDFFKNTRELFLDVFRNIKNTHIWLGDYQIEDLEPKNFIMVGWFAIDGNTVYTEEEKRVFITIKVKEFKVVSFTLTMPVKRRHVYNVKNGCRNVYIYEDSILYLEKEINKNNTIWHYGGGSTFYENAPLAQHMLYFPEQFVQINRHVIVNLRHVKSMERDSIVMKDGKVFYLSNPAKINEKFRSIPGVMPSAR